MFNAAGIIPIGLIEHVALLPTTENVSLLCACRPTEEEEFYDSFEVGEDHEFEHVHPPTDRQAAPANETPLVQSADHHVTGSAVTVSIQEALSRIHGNLQLILQRLNGLEDAVKALQRQSGVSAWFERVVCVKQGANEVCVGVV